MTMTSSRSSLLRVRRGVLPHAGLSADMQPTAHAPTSLPVPALTSDWTDKESVQTNKLWSDNWDDDNVDEDFVKVSGCARAPCLEE